MEMMRQKAGTKLAAGQRRWKKRSRTLLWVLGLLLFLVSGGGGGQAAGAEISADFIPPEAPVLEKAVSRDRLELIDEELTVTKRDMDGALDDAEKAVLSRKAQNLRSLRSLIQRHRTLQEKHDTLLQELEKARLTTSSLYVLDQEPPYGLSLYDKHLDDFEVLKEQTFFLKAAVTASEKELASLEERLEEVQELLRGVEEEVTAKEASGEMVSRELRLRFEELLLEEELLKMGKTYQLLLGRTYEKDMELLDLKKTAVSDLLKKIKGNLGVSQEVLQKQMAQADEAAIKLREQVVQISSERDKVALALDRARKRLNEAEEEEKRVIAASEVAEFQAWKDYYQTVLEQKEILLQYMDVAQDMWEHRYSLIGETPGELEKLKEVKKRLEIGREDLARLAKRIQSQQMAQQSRIGALQKKLEDSSQPYADLIQGNLEGELEALQELARETLLFASSVTQIALLAQRLDQELGEAIGSFQISEHVTALGKRTFRDFWSMEVWVLEGNQITVGELLIALGLLFGGFALIRILSGWISRRFQKRFNMTPETTSLVRRIFFYLFFFLTILWVLRIVNIPLTAFAFLGGALAIAVGFGAQHLFSNFISGFFLVIQKPIKVGDIVQIEDGTVALVKEIGPRHTRLQDFNNVDILLPNSYLLENKIINWTYADKKLRNKLSVGVAYGSDTKKAEDLLLKAAREHPNVLTNPLPFVIFKEFGESSLNFDLYFWVDMNYSSGLTVGSELRHQVAALFRENHMEIPFPQMDVYLKKAPSSPPESPEVTEPLEISAGEKEFLEDDMEPGEGIDRG